MFYSQKFFFWIKIVLSGHIEHYKKFVKLILNMSYKIEEVGNSKIVHLTGEIDMDVADKARQTILPLIEAGHEVHLNLSKVEYMDSSGISVLIESKKLSEQKKTRFELVEVSKPVEKVLAMARKFL